jgi:hypothetical protein
MVHVCYHVQWEEREYTPENLVERALGPLMRERHQKGLTGRRSNREKNRVVDLDEQNVD